MRSFFIFDVESVGLHGEGFAVAGGVYLENGAAQWEFFFCCSLPAARGNDVGRQWVESNVPNFDATHRTPVEVRRAFWEQWLKAKAQYPEIAMAVECGWPVEARFLAACIDDVPNLREWKGPYPLHEIASIMLAAGMDPMKKYDRESSELPEHNPLSDARLSARLLSEALELL